MEWPISFEEHQHMNKNRYVDLLVDFSFKKIFGTDTNKALLIDLLNAVFAGRKVIVDLQYNKNEHHGNNIEEGAAIFDLLCTGNKGEKILIEVQHSRPVNFKKRSIFYVSRLISDQAPKGKIKEWAYNITEVYFIAILDQKETDETEDKLISDGRYIHDVCLNYRNSPEIFYDQLGFTYLDLTNFVLTLAQCESKLEKWLYHLKHLQDMKRLPNGLEKTIFEQLYNIAEYTKMNKKEQQMYDEAQKRKWDNAAVMMGAEQRGEARGIAKGKLEAAIENARRMISDGLSPDLIAKYTGLTLEEVENL